MDASSQSYSWPADPSLNGWGLSDGVPVATLKRRIDGLVPMDARPGLSIILKDKLCEYCLDMADIG